MDSSSAGSGRSRPTGKQRDASVLPRAGAMLTATRERVKNTRRLITQSRDLLRRARQAVNSSKLLRPTLERASRVDPR
ncbi:MAG TPA: hypothetical protein VFW31_02270 [Candidatus Angelobacter sp.]|nr:hypothetical protein [Candidatus Angelobacter sp.]